MNVGNVRIDRLEMEALRDLVAHSVDLASWRVSDAGEDVPYASALKSLAAKVGHIYAMAEGAGDFPSEELSDGDVQGGM